MTVHRASRVSHVVNVKDFSASGNGVTDDYIPISSAITSIGANERVLYFPAGTYYIGTSITTGTNITVEFDRGAIIQDNGDAGVTFTINGSLDAGPYQIFNFSGAGSGVAAGSTIISENGKIFPEWWGAARDGVTDDSTAIQSAIDLIGRASSSWTGGTVYFSRGTYAIGTELQVDEQGINLIGDSGAILLSSGLTGSEAIVKVTDSVGVIIDTLIFYGSSATPPLAAIYFYQPGAGGSDVGSNEHCVVRNCRIGRINAIMTPADTYPFVNGVHIGGPVSGNNDSMYIENTQIFDCSGRGIYLENDQSIWGHLNNVFTQNCGYGIWCGCNAQISNSCFNRNTVDLYLFRDITVNVNGFNSEHSGLPIDIQQAASLYIRGGKVLLNAELTSSVWLDATGFLYLHLEDFQVVESGATNTYINVAGSSSNLGHLHIKDCRLPNMDDGSGVDLSGVNAGTLGGYIDIEHGPYVFKQFIHHSWTYDPASLSDGDGVSSQVTGSTIADITAGDLVVLSFTQDLSDVILTGAAYANQSLGWRFQNESGGVVDLASGYIRWRKISSNQTKIKVSTTYDCPLLTNGNGTTTTVSCPGADYGDFVVWGANHSTYRSLLVTPYVSSPGIVSVRVQNETGGASDPASVTLNIALLKENWEYIAAKTFDPSNLADGAGETTTITVEGVSIGDSVVASFSHDLQGLLMYPYVSAADTVSVRFQNETGAAVNLSSGTLRVMVQPSR